MNEWMHFGPRGGLGAATCCGRTEPVHPVQVPLESEYGPGCGFEEGKGRSHTGLRAGTGGREHCFPQHEGDVGRVRPGLH